METGLKVRAQGFRTLCTQVGTFRGGDVTGEAEWKACAVWTYPEGGESGATEPACAIDARRSSVSGKMFPGVPTAPAE